MKAKFKLFNLILSMMLMLILASCSSDVQEAACSNQEDFNPIFRQCVPKALGTSVKIEDSTPTLSYEISITTTTPIEHAVQVADPFAQGYHTEWFLYQIGSPGVLVANDVDTYSVIPNLMAAGNYSLEALVKDKDRVRVLDKRTWTIVVSALAPPNLSAPIPSVSSVSFTTVNSPGSFQVTVNNPDLVSGYALEYFFDGNIATSSAIPPIALTNLSYIFDPTNPSLALGSHVLQAFVKNSLGQTVDTQTWTIILTNPALPIISAQEIPVATTITSIDGVNIGADGFLNLGTPVSFCIQTDDFDGTQNNGLAGTHAQFFLVNIGSGLETPISAEIDFTASNTDLCLRAANGGFALNLANPQIGESKIISVKLTDKLTGLIADTRSWVTSIRPKNTPPVIAADVPSNAATLIYEQDTLNNFSFTVTDLDSLLPDEFETEFLLNGSSVCLHPRLSGQPANIKYACPVTINSYDASGPVAPGPNTLIAVTRDTAVAAWGGVNQESNQLVWSVTTTESQTAPVVALQDTTGPGPADPGFSYIHLTADMGLNPISAAVENDAITFNIIVTDAERDDLLYTISRCQTIAGVSCVNLAFNQSFTKSDGNLESNFTFNHIISQDAVQGAANGIVYYKVAVTDVPHTVAALSDFKVYQLLVTNNNPPPILVGPSAPDAATTLITPITVITGLPASLDPGVITDASTTDGEILQYQWGISTSLVGPFTNISGGINKVLTWTPPASIAGVDRYLRICIGDNGFGNDVVACAINQTWRITPVTNLVLHNGASAAAAAGEVATWFDTANNTLYTAYAAGVNPSTEVNIVQTLYNPDGTTAEASIVFPSEDALVTATHFNITDLSIVGNPANNSLYVSYLGNEPAFPGFSKRLKVRRVDITPDGRLGFAYSGLVFDDVACFTPVFDGVANMTTITTAMTCNYGDAIEINGVSFELSPTPGFVGNVRLVPVNTASPTLDQDVAASLTAIVNGQGSDPRLQVLVGPNVVNQGVVLLNTVEVDHSDLTRDVLDDTRLISSAGSIMVHNDAGTDYWYIPFLDLLNDSKLLFFRSLASGTLSNTLHVPLEPVGTEQSVEIVNRYSPTQAAFVVAVRSNAGTVHVYDVDPAAIAAPPAKIDDVFSSPSVHNIHIAAGKVNNPYVYIMGQDTSVMNSPLALTRISDVVLSGSTGICPSGCITENPIDDNGTGLGESVFQFKINSSSQMEEAIIALISSTDTKAHIGKISGATPVMDFTSAPVLATPDAANTSVNVDGSPVYKIALTDLLSDVNDNTGITLGDPGSVAVQNTVNGFFFTHFKTLVITDPETAFININNEVTIDNNVDVNDEINGFMFPYIR